MASRYLSDDEIQMEFLKDEPEDNFGGDNSDGDPDFMETQEPSDTEESECSEVASNLPQGCQLACLTENTLLTGKSGYKWHTADPPRRSRTRADDIVLHLPGPKGAARNVQTPKDTCELLIDDDITSSITAHTNEEIQRKISIVVQRQSYHNSTDSTEIRALLGLFYFCGVKEDVHVSLEELWSKKFGSSLYRSSITQRRFEFMSSSLRFDDKITRTERKKCDNFAPIRHLE
jgi:hypothetical protein